MSNCNDHDDEAEQSRAFEQQRSKLHIVRAALECIYDWSATQTVVGWLEARRPVMGLKYSNALHLFVPFSFLNLLCKWRCILGIANPKDTMTPIVPLLKLSVTMASCRSRFMGRVCVSFHVLDRASLCTISYLVSRNVVCAPSLIHYPCHNLVYRDRCPALHQPPLRHWLCHAIVSGLSLSPFQVLSFAAFSPCCSSFHSSTSIFRMCFPGTTTKPTNLFTISTLRFSVEPDSCCAYAASAIVEGEGWRYSWVRERIMFNSWKRLLEGVAKVGAGVKRVREQL